MFGTLLTCALCLVCNCPNSSALPAYDHIFNDQIWPDGIHVLDGSYVLDVGELQVHITNHGLIGSQYSSDVPYSYAPSAQWPSGSGHEYLWAAGLWVGGRIGGNVSVSTGQYERELRPGNDLDDTIYESINGRIQRPIPYDHVTGWRYPTNYTSDDDQDGQFNEDWLNGKDDDGDGMVDEDFAHLGEQMFTCTMYDNQPLALESYPDHRPLGIRVVQRAVAWSDDELDDIVGLDFEITNVGHETVEDMYLGFFVDSDIRSRDQGYDVPDDLAGFFRGAVRAEDGLFYRANIAYMLDGAEENPLPGCLGVMLIDHTIDFLGRDAPFHYEVNSFQIFSTNAAYNQEGEPTLDVDRYHAMSRPNNYDRNTRPEEAADMKYLISSGPFGHFVPGTTLNYRVAMIAGHGVQGMLQTAVTAAQLGAGRYHIWGQNWFGSYETKVCLGDIRPFGGGDGTDPLLGRRSSSMNESCSGSDPIPFVTVLREDDFHEEEDGRFCVWVNMDNCEECFRILGHDCTEEEFRSTSMGAAGTSTRSKPWVWAKDVPPPRPRFRIEPHDNRVEIFWDDSSEHTVDPFYNINDFESYRIWRVSDWVPPAGSFIDAKPPGERWGMIEEYDVENFVLAEIGGTSVDQPLGRNTGLEIARYIPACLNDPRFEGLAAAMQAVVDQDSSGHWFSRPSVRRSNGEVVPGLEGLVRWETYPAVLDTFYDTAERVADTNVVPKTPMSYYHHIDQDVHNGFQVYYSMTASDHMLAEYEDQYYPVAYGIEEDPGNEYQFCTPRPEAQTAEHLAKAGRNIYVYPNPATRQALAEFQARPTSLEDPTGVRVTWNNLPRSLNTIHIYTTAGDLVDTLYHDGFSQGGSISWNLVSRNGQEVVSGIYIYVVHSDDGAFPDYQGRFVVIL